ncbi:uncharacterized protein BO97DRAFT_449054 [Aspergillus homomorphus CBS 101889]|uniref:Uncharacterized protein n=1 Tax=Aspergillus homomorphus (strain CBS 101889) TaxID=1450537 RepID=A0A395HK02_ASPHC|nr:hypothetical protein BO97DRAFT_449054 [Aspergillus homomorphus CBS 101889]RAL06584.1 hypothetical protein BO97DRAFT_449054 [Aspergillus homomorphus CBS 101889]
MIHLLSAGITLIHTLTIEPWNALQIRRVESPFVVIEASTYSFAIPIQALRKSVFGWAFLLYHGGFFLDVLSFVIQHRNDQDFQPLFGGDGLRAAARHQRGCAFFCPIAVNDGFKVVPYSLLERTIPGRLLIWQADHPMLDVTFRTRLFVAGKLFKAAAFGVSRTILHKSVSFLCLFLHGALWVCIQMRRKFELWMRWDARV